MTPAELLALRGADLAGAAEALRADPSRRQPIAGYQGLADLDAIDAPAGARLFARAGELVLIYLGPDALPPQLSDEDLAAAIGSSGEQLPSRQGKNATLHVAAEQGIAWSEEDGRIAFVEVFPPMTGEDYLRRVYLEPPAFIQ